MKPNKNPVRHMPSKQYQKILAYINQTPDLLSLLYDLNLLPEVVQDIPTDRRLMVAVYLGWRAAKGDET